MVKNAYFHGSIESPRRTIITNDYKNERTLIVVLPKDPSEQYRPMPLGKKYGINLVIVNLFHIAMFLLLIQIYVYNMPQSLGNRAKKSQLELVQLYLIH